MNALWSHFWPFFAAGLMVGTVAGWAASRAKIVRVRERPHEPEFVRKPRRWRFTVLAVGLAVSIAASIAWHGPLGAADRFTSRVERIARQVLVDFDAPAGITVRIRHDPLTRQLMLSGRADDFQRSEASRLLSQVPGVSQAVWSPTIAIPLIVEGAIASLLGFLCGLLIAYLLELRRRYNAQWTW